jgi:6-phosphofructokinase 1
MTNIRKIALVTRDCSGVNAAIRSVVRTAGQHSIEVLGSIKGYEGLIDGHFIPLNRRSVSGLINQGGTILKTSRCARFYTTEGQQAAVRSIKSNDIDAVIVIGGNGSLQGAHALATYHQIPVIGIPATIDNDIFGVDLSIGADTAVNVALDALNKIRDTATSLERIFVVEVMGRNCGWIALQVALAGGCEEVLIPEISYSAEQLANDIKTGVTLGKESWIVVVAEGAARASEVSKIITERTGLETRITVLGHIQRGGQPTAIDRVLATRLGNYAIHLLSEGVNNVYVNQNNGTLGFLSIKNVLERKVLDISEYYSLVKQLV